MVGLDSALEHEMKRSSMASMTSVPALKSQGGHPRPVDTKVGKEAVYKMAMRGVLLAWEDPEQTIVERLQMTDLLREAFSLSEAEHRDALEAAMQDNEQVAAELMRRVEEFEVEEFVSSAAAEEWNDEERAQLRELAKQQLSLPVFNAMLEVAVLEVRPGVLIHAACRRVCRPLWLSCLTRGTLLVSHRARTWPGSSRRAFSPACTPTRRATTVSWSMCSRTSRRAAAPSARPHT